MPSKLDYRLGLVGSILVLALAAPAGADPLYTITDISNRAPAAPWTAGIAGATLNDVGQVAGSYQSSPTTVSGFIYDSRTGQVTTIPAPSSSTPATAMDPSSTFIDGINNSGQIIGFQIPAGGTYTTGFLDTNGQFSMVPGTPMAINNTGQVSGVLAYINGQMTDQSPYSLLNAVSHNYIDTNGTVKDLGPTPAPGPPVNLGALPGDMYSIAEASNNNGQTVGTSLGGFFPHAFLYQNGTMINLTSLLAPNSGVTLTDAVAINNVGQILAEGFTTGDSWERLYLLTPVGDPQPVAPNTLITPTPEPSTLAIFAIASAAWAARRLVRRRRKNGP